MEMDLTLANRFLRVPPGIVWRYRAVKLAGYASLYIVKCILRMDPKAPFAYR